MTAEVSTSGAAGKTRAPYLRRLMADQGRKHWRGYAVAFVCMALIGLTTSLAAYLMKDVINKIFIERQGSYIALLAGAVVVLYTVKGLATFGQQVILARIANSIVADMQRRMYDHMLRLGTRFFDEHHSSEFVTRQTFIANSASRALNLIVTSLGRDLLTVIGLATVMIIQDPLLAVVGLIVMPVAVLTVRTLVKRARKVMHQEFGGAMAITETLQETVRGIRTLKSFTLERIFRGRMHGAVSDFERAANKLASVSARSAPLMETLGGFAIAGIILYGGYRVVEGGQSPGSFFSFITALLLAYDPAKRLARVHIEFSASMVGVQMLYEFLDIRETEKDAPDAPALKVTRGEVTFRNVNFAYRPGETVLRALSLTAEPGRMTALVGPSGGGKSTIISLLQRSYDIASGEICIDGQNINHVSLASLRANISVVSQDPFLFKGTIMENIAFGNPDADEASVIAAARSAFAHDFISEFAEGYHSQVGEQGHQLSGGQRQRIAIARAILKDAPILLLDEATAALDAESEGMVQRALEDLSKGRTTLVIAHRLQTIRKADRIFVIENGTVVEQGDHDALIAAKGRYADLRALLA